MNETTCEGTNPCLAVCYTTTGHDYGNFLEGVLSYKPLSKEIVDISERNWTPFLKGQTMYGDYGFGHFLFCFDNPEGFSEECKEAQQHADPGGYGYWPMIDRKNGYYVQVVVMESGAYYARSGIPEYLGAVIKPIIDEIMAGTDVSKTAQHHTPAFNSLSLVDINYISNCYIHPLSCA